MREVVKGMKGKQPKPEKPKVVECANCGQLMVSTQECYACQNRLLVENYKTILEDIKFGEQAPPPPAWIIAICDEALEV